MLSLFFYYLKAVPSFQSVPSAAEVRPPLAGGSGTSSADALHRIRDPLLWNHSLWWSIFTTWQRSTLCKITTCQRIFVCISFCCTISQYSHTKWACYELTIRVIEKHFWHKHWFFRTSVNNQGGHASHCDPTIELQYKHSYLRSFLVIVFVILIHQLKSNFHIILFYCINVLFWIFRSLQYIIGQTIDEQWAYYSNIIMIKVDKSSILNRKRGHKYFTTLCYIIYSAGMQKN